MIERQSNDPDKNGVGELRAILVFQSFTHLGAVFTDEGV